MENRPPDVFPYESDNSVSNSSSEEISDYNEHENPSRKTKVNSDCQEGKAVCDSDSEPSSGEISESDMEGGSDNGEDCVEFVRAVPTQNFSTMNLTLKIVMSRKASLNTTNTLPFSLPYYLSTQVQAIMKGLSLFWK